MNNVVDNLIQSRADLVAIELMKARDLVRIPNQLSVATGFCKDVIRARLKEKPIKTFKVAGTECASWSDIQEWLRS